MQTLDPAFGRLSAKSNYFDNQDEQDNELVMDEMHLWEDRR